MSHTLVPDPKQNRILAALSTNDFARLQDDLELVSLKVGQVLYDAAQTAEVEAVHPHATSELAST